MMMRVLAVYHRNGPITYGRELNSYGKPETVVKGVNGREGEAWIIHRYNKVFRRSCPRHPQSPSPAISHRQGSLSLSIGCLSISLHQQTITTDMSALLAIFRCFQESLVPLQITNRQLTMETSPDKPTTMSEQQPLQPRVKSVLDKDISSKYHTREDRAARF